MNASQLGGTPDRQRVVLRYTTIITRAPNGVAAADYVFSGNGIFDPDITSTGGQPANYDDYSALYGRYRVYGSKISAHATADGSVTTGTGLYTTLLAARHTTTALSTASALLDGASQPHSMVKTWISTFPYFKNELKMSATTAQILGYKTQAIDDDDTLQALTSANPNHQFYWHISTYINSGSGTSNVYFYVCIDYDVEFFDRLDTLIDSKLMRVPKLLVPSVDRLVHETKTMSEDYVHLRTKAALSIKGKHEPSDMN
jgi:hypothetical protein